MYVKNTFPNIIRISQLPALCDTNRIATVNYYYEIRCTDNDKIINALYKNHYFRLQVPESEGHNS